MFKKDKIRRYLDIIKTSGNFSAFEFLLSDYLSGKLKQKLSEIGFSKIEIYVDWLENYKCINIQGKSKSDIYIDFQAEKNEFFIALSKDEPDDGSVIRTPKEADASFYYSELATRLNEFNKEES
ncbi:hypothetical protein [Porcipelethomonas sp.]|uniref:hypothetical protein n=1 Tax=Porcipelethomonas sp. TaxID=2981675 RepID=UPI003EF833AD